MITCSPFQTTSARIPGKKSIVRSCLMACTHLLSVKRISISFHPISWEVLSSSSVRTYGMPNYMLGVMLPDTFRHQNNFEIILDKRTIKVDHGNNFAAYIRTKCWGDLGMDVDIECKYDSSDKNEGIWMADWMENWIWRRYENNQCGVYNVLKVWDRTHFFEKTLFIR